MTSAGYKWLSKTVQFKQQRKGSVSSSHASSVTSKPATRDASTQADFDTIWEIAYPHNLLQRPDYSEHYRNNTLEAKLIRIAQTGQWEVFKSTIARYRSSYRKQGYSQAKRELQGEQQSAQ